MKLSTLCLAKGDTECILVSQHVHSKPSCIPEEYLQICTSLKIWKNYICPSRTALILDIFFFFWKQHLKKPKEQKVRNQWVSSRLWHKIHPYKCTCARRRGFPTPWSIHRPPRSSLGCRTLGICILASCIPTALCGKREYRQNTQMQWGWEFEANKSSRGGCPSIKILNGKTNATLLR